jgi:D-glycero-alpha-D-manno-heptose-7-phosphate kinase
MIIARTPFRISFFGGGTDFPEFYREHGGSTLLTTIDKYSYISIHRISQFFDFKYRASYAKTEPVQHPSQFQHPLIRECLLHLNVNEGLEISHVSDLPGRSGLGTSSSFTVGLLLALHTLHEDRVTAADLAREAIIVERERVKDAGGHQDQYAAAYGGFIRLNFSGDQNVNVQQLNISMERIRELESRLLLFYTGVEKSAEETVCEQKKRTAQNIPALKEMLAMVDDAEMILTDSKELDDFGRLLHSSWMLKKSLSKGISNSDIDRLYEAARSAGALGGKLLGAGGRGFLLVYAQPDCHAGIRSKLSHLREVDFAFSPRGSEVIFQTATDKFNALRSPWQAPAQESFSLA